MPFQFTRLEIDDVIMIQPRVFPDDRGFFLELYKSSDFRNSGIGTAFLQDNYSLSRKGVIRGLHYQLPPKSQGKLVSVIRGAVWDVAVDIRRSSGTFTKWVACELSGSNHTMLYIPPGFAHGFIALTDDVHLLYKCTEEYAPEVDSGIRWDDPELDVRWPLKNPMVSTKDAELPFLKDATLFP
jgi:dTDP-4-dehydrorhamnose 3,5-epimerase